MLASSKTLAKAASCKQAEPRAASRAASRAPVIQRKRWPFRDQRAHGLQRSRLPAPSCRRPATCSRSSSPCFIDGATTTYIVTHASDEPRSDNGTSDDEFNLEPRDEAPTTAALAKSDDETNPYYKVVAALAPGEIIGRFAATAHRASRTPSSRRSWVCSATPGPSRSRRRR